MKNALAVLLLALITACATPSNTPQATGVQPVVAVYPAGVRPFKNPTAASRAGLYASNSIHNCCFLKQRATLILEKPAGARLATLSFFVPDVEPFKSGQTVTVSSAGVSATATGIAGKWMAISLALPPAYFSRMSVPVAISSSKSCNPAKLGINNDARDLSVVLKNVEYH